MRPRLDREFVRWMWLFNKSATEAHVERSAPLLRDLHLASRGMYEEWAHTFRDDFGLVTRGLLMLCKSEHG